MSIDPEFVELTADVLKLFLYNTSTNHYSGEKQHIYIETKEWVPSH